MISASQTVYWTGVQFVDLKWLMKRVFRIRATFEPSRLSGRYLRQAYEMLLPVGRRQIDSAKEGEEESVVTATSPSRDNVNRGGRA